MIVKPSGTLLIILYLVDGFIDALQAQLIERFKADKESQAAALGRQL